MEKFKIKLLPPFIKGMIVAYMIAAFFVFLFVACEDVYIGKTKEEIAIELSQTMFEVDSILMSIQYQLDTTSVDGTYYLNMQRINNGHP